MHFFVLLNQAVVRFFQHALFVGEVVGGVENQLFQHFAHFFAVALFLVGIQLV